jgi:hypothetical protein
MTRTGDLIGFNLHARILATDGCFYGNKGMFLVAPPWNGRPPCVLIDRTRESKWCSHKDSATLSETTYSFLLP